MTENEKMPLGRREPLPNKTLLVLQGENGGRADFIITGLLGAGGTALVYTAVRQKDGVGGALKAFFPAQEETEYRQDGTPILLRTLCEGYRQQLSCIQRRLRTIKQDAERGLRFFIPYTEVYTDAAGTPYLFTPENPEGTTLQAYCRKVWQNPDERALYQILHAVYALACADGQLCRAGVLLLDHKPDNVLLIAKSTGNTAPKEFLQDAVCLFDTGSAVLWQELDTESVLPFSAGFTAPELGGYVSPAQPQKIGPASDVYAMAALLFYCLSGGKFALADTARGYAQRLLNGPFAPYGKEIFGRLGVLLAKALRYDPAKRLAEPLEFARGVAEIAAQAQQQDADAAAARRQKLETRMPELLANLFYRSPPYGYGDGKNQIRVLIVSDNAAMALAAIREAFSDCQVCGYKIFVRLAGVNAKKICETFAAEVDHAENWFCLQAAEDTDPYYNAKKYLGHLSWTQSAPAQAVTEFEPGTVLLLERRDMAAEAQKIPAPKTGHRLIAYTDTGAGCTLYYDVDEDCRVFTAIKADTAEDVYQSIADKIAYSVHRRYETRKNPQISAESLRRSFADSYNRKSSLLSAMAVKCRMQALGLSWQDDAMEKKSREYARAVLSEEKCARLAYAEHRRWCAALLCSGVKTLPPAEYTLLPKSSTNSSGTMLLQNGEKKHIYLVQNAEKEKRPYGWRTAQDWVERAREQAPLPKQLDEFSRAGAALAAVYTAYIPQTIENLKSDRVLLQACVQRAIPALEAEPGRQLAEKLRALDTVLDAVLVDPQPHTFAEWEQIQEELTEFLEIQQKDVPRCGICLETLKDIQKDIFPLAYTVRPVDPKQMDWAIVSSFPFEFEKKQEKEKEYVLKR